MTTVQIIWGLVVVVFSTALGFILPRLVTTGSRDLGNRLQKLEDAGFNMEFRVLLAERLKGIEMTMAMMKENQKDALDDIEKSIALAVRSPHTPELDVYLDMIALGVALTTEQYMDAIHIVDDLIKNPETHSGQKSSYATLRGIMVTKMKRQAREKAVYAA